MARSVRSATRHQTRTTARSFQDLQAPARKRRRQDGAKRRLPIVSCPSPSLSFRMTKGTTAGRELFLLVTALLVTRCSPWPQASGVMPRLAQRSLCAADCCRNKISADRYQATPASLKRPCALRHRIAPSASCDSTAEILSSADAQIASVRRDDAFLGGYGYFSEDTAEGLDWPVLW